MASRYSRKIFICPYYTGNTKGLVRCEGGSICFAQKKLQKHYVESFCASFEWQKCTIATALKRFEAEGESIDTGKRKYVKIRRK